MQNADNLPAERPQLAKKTKILKFEISGSNKLPRRKRRIAGFIGVEREIKRSNHYAGSPGVTPALLLLCWLELQLTRRRSMLSVLYPLVVMTGCLVMCRGVPCLCVLGPRAYHYCGNDERTNRRMNRRGKL